MNRAIHFHDFRFEPESTRLWVGSCEVKLTPKAAMLLGALGWNHYAAAAEVITPFFPSSGTGQINVVFPVTPMPSDLQGVGKSKSTANSPRL